MGEEVRAACWLKYIFRPGKGLMGRTDRMEKVNYFNIRAYGFLVNEENQVLLSDEREYGQEFTKFPGGGVELGEGVVDALLREFMEECGIPVQVVRHIHTTEDLVVSAFTHSQVIAIYYQVKATAEDLEKISLAPRPPQGEPVQAFRWVPIDDFDIMQLTFGIDQKAWQKFSLYS